MSKFWDLMTGQLNTTTGPPDANGRHPDGRHTVGCGVGESCGDCNTTNPPSHSQQTRTRTSLSGLFTGTHITEVKYNGQWIPITEETWAQNLANANQKRR